MLCGDQRDRARHRIEVVARMPRGCRVFLGGHNLATPPSGRRNLWRVRRRSTGRSQAIAGQQHRTLLCFNCQRYDGYDDSCSCIAAESSL